MTILTPTYHEQDPHAGNGQAGPVHIVPPHEPTREGEAPRPQFFLLPNGQVLVQQVPVTPVAPDGPLKVALIGTAPSSRDLAPYDDLSWKIWGCSPGNMNCCKRVDLWFELHSNLMWKEHEHYGKPYIEWLNKQTFPIYMQNNIHVPKAMVFPWYEMTEQFGKEFFTSSFAWMMALAITMGAAEISLYGIDMASRDEYIRQRPGFYYFKRRAEERGIKVTAPHESDIMQPPALYAYQDSTPQGRKLMARRKEVSDRASGHGQQIQQHQHNQAYLNGALEDIDYQETIWIGVSTDLLIETERNIRLTARNAQLEAQIAQMQQHIAQLQPPQSAPAEPVAAAAPERPKRQRKQRVKPEAEQIPLPEPAAMEQPMEASNG
jgi:hypothetical protein